MNWSRISFPSLKRRGGCGINQKVRSHRSAADGVVSSAKLFRPQDFADLLLRLRPIGLALRATPSARTKVAGQYFLDRASTPPFQRGEGRLIPIHSHLLTLPSPNGEG